MRRPNFNFVQELLVTIVDRMGPRTLRGTDSPQPAYKRATEACHRLMSRSGEASQVAIATEAISAYGHLTSEEKRRFFQLLLNDYGVEPEALRAAYADWDKQPNDAAAVRLFNAVEPKRQTLLRRLNLSTGGTSALVEMRADLLKLIKSEPALAPVDADFEHLFASWFNRGFLVMRRIDWHTSAHILDKIVEYEAVHEIRDWDDLRRRLDPADRRCYAFFHPSTGDEPLIFVEVALCRGVPRRIGPLLSLDDQAAVTREFDTAVFYSISNCQNGLRGVSFGNFLIKQVVQELHEDLPELQNFVTLSPMPGFARWLKAEAERHSELNILLNELEQGETMDRHLASAEDAARLRALAAEYLMTQSPRTSRPIDPVARFHLGNGACVYSVNWPADTSVNGMANSFGAMVNYLYELDKIDERHEKFISGNEIALADELQRDLQKLRADA